MVERHLTVLNLQSLKDLMKEIETSYLTWQIKAMGGLKKYPGSQHFHLTSDIPEEKGVLELTLLLPGDVFLKIAGNRDGDWARDALAHLESLINKIR